MGAGGAEAARLDSDSRSAALAALAGAEFQVLVVGGGVVGAGVALDAATRGLSVGLVEARDFASGTSSRSSKLIHGGLRYLEQLNIGLVREALTERSLLLGVIAPHLVRPVPSLLPLTHHGWERAYIGTGIGAYDALGFSLGLARGLPGHHQLSRRGALRLVPGLKRSAITGAVAFWDGQVDDARYVLTLVRTAAHYGAQIASRVQVTGFLREGARVAGVRAVDLESGAEISIRAQQVVNATGVWTDEIQAMVGGRGMINLRVSKGIHLVVPKDRVHSSTGIIARTPDSVLFIIPWGRHWIIGTTDTDWVGSKSEPAASRADIDYLIGQANRLLKTPLTRDDVVGVYTGLRPLLAGGSESPSRLSREHVVAHPVPGLVLVAGGKYTTYRLMARDAGDAGVPALGWRAAPPPCRPGPPARGGRGAGRRTAGWGRGRRWRAWRPGRCGGTRARRPGRSRTTGRAPPPSGPPRRPAQTPTPTRSGRPCRTSCRCWTPGMTAATARAGWAAWPGEWGAAATRLRPCLRHACSPASSRPPTPSISAITWARSASGWPCRRPMTPSTAWLTCTRSRCRRTRPSCGAGPGWRPRSCSRPAWIPTGASCSSRATSPSTPSSPGC